MNPDHDRGLSQNDPSLDLLLKAIASIQTDSGFEQRVLHRIETRTAERQPRRNRLLLRTFGFASVVTAALLIAFALRHPRPATVPTQLANLIAPQAQSAPLTPRQFPTQAINSHHSERSEEPLYSSLSAHPERQLAPSDRSVQLVSFPAPPAPLTEQERLLLRIAHTGDPEEFAALNPETRTSLEEQHGAETLEFFKNQLPPEDTADQTTIDDKGDAR